MSTNYTHFLTRVQNSPLSHLSGTIENSTVNWQTYSDTLTKIHLIALFLKTLKKYPRIGFYSKNVPEHFICECAVHLLGTASVPLYAAYGPVAIQHVIDDTEIKVCFMSSEMLKSYLNELKEKRIVNKLEIVILYDSKEKIDPDEFGIKVFYYEKIVDEKETCNECYAIDFDDIFDKSENVNEIMKNLSISTQTEINLIENKPQNKFDDNFEKSTQTKKTNKSKSTNTLNFYEVGKKMTEQILKNEDPKKVYEKVGLKMPNLDEISLICYTSGTTGNPKGVVLTHKNMGAVHTALKDKSIEQFNSNDVYLSYLPLAHVFERVVLNGLIAKGVKIVYWRGDIRKLGDDLKIAKPTLFAGVPLVYRRFKSKILEKVTGCKKVLFNFFLEHRIAQQENGNGFGNSNFFYKIIFGKVRAEFGGRLRMGFCGGAALDAETCKFMQGVLGVRIFQGYGQTETAACTMMPPVACHRVDVVGMPLGGTEAKLVDCGDGRTELFLKGDGIFREYFNDQKKTEEAFCDGWLSTGDIATVVDGMYKILGRKKDIFKLSNGEYIVLENIENKIRIDFGDEFDFIVTPTKDGEELVLFVGCENKEIKEVFEKKIEECFRKKILAKYERPVEVIVTEPFENFPDAYNVKRDKKRHVLNDELLKKYYKK